MYFSAAAACSFSLLYSIPSLFYNLFITSSVSGHLGCFPFVTIINAAAMNVPVYIFWDTFFCLSVPRGGIAG